MNDIIKCPHCGKAFIDNENKTCPYCGKVLDDFSWLNPFGDIFKDDE